MIKDNIVCFGSHDSYCYALNAVNSDFVWRFKTEGNILSSPSIADTVLYIGSYDSYLYALNIRNGKMLWRFDTESVIFSTPKFYNDAIYFGGYDRNVYAVETYKHEGFKDNKKRFNLPEKQFSVSPNPFSSRLSVSLPSSGAIYSITGQLIMNLPKGKHSLDTSSWRGGVYIVKCHNSSIRIVKF